MDALEPFHPDRMASRILGMGDVLTLIEKAQEQYDEKKALELQRKMMKADFTFEDFLDQMRTMRKMGPLKDLLSMIPGLGKQLKDVEIDEKQMTHTEAMILSMTPWERRHPDRIDHSRRRRIAVGSGRPIADVHRLIKQFDESRKMMKQLAGMEKTMKKGRMPGNFSSLFGGSRNPFKR
jgi:signal recognition particle subunit SRP54